MKQNLSKKEIQQKIDLCFANIENKSPKEIQKIKKLAMSKNIPLGGYKKLFCKKCFTPYINPKIRIKNKLKIITCPNCNKVSRWKLK